MTAIPAAAVTLVVLLVAARTQPTIGLATFTSVSAAATQAAGAVTVLLPIAATLIALVPAVAAVSPVLAASPEGAGAAAEDPGTLRGAIAVEHVTFAYSEGTPVLDDVSVRIEPGTMAAIVGPSGSGKSTMVRVPNRSSLLRYRSWVRRELWSHTGSRRFGTQTRSSCSLMAGLISAGHLTS